TGEEDETEVHKQRSVLYRFDDNQWKERGVGDMKILKNKTNGRVYRLLFRRDQIHKVVCNHLLTPDIKLKPMQTSEKAWCWFANDFSDGEVKMEHFAIRFKTADVAREFKEVVENCQKGLFYFIICLIEQLNSKTWL
ncbi:hypothetical protein HELRODRAFT_64615, partial [Helobdella robusta]|uniref:RanBD1 domain-containing protein n=1 Tax=Helobdella robusta TaxID=6412 RepID=T1FXX0_HELRO